MKIDALELVRPAAGPEGAVALYGEVELESCAVQGWRAPGSSRVYRSEDEARYALSTHRACGACGGPARKPYTACEACRAKRARQRWESLEPAPPDYTGLVFEWVGDRSWGDEEEALDELAGDIEELGLAHSQIEAYALATKAAMLVDAVPCPPPAVDLDDLVASWAGSAHGPGVASLAEHGIYNLSKESSALAEQLEQALARDVGQWFEPGKLRILLGPVDQEAVR